MHFPSRPATDVILRQVSDSGWQKTRSRATSNLGRQIARQHDQFKNRNDSTWLFTHTLHPGVYSEVHFIPTTRAVIPFTHTCYSSRSQPTELNVHRHEATTADALHCRHREAAHDVRVKHITLQLTFEGRIRRALCFAFGVLPSVPRNLRLSAGEPGDVYKTSRGW